jgi:hypothetical protein
MLALTAHVRHLIDCAFDSTHVVPRCRRMSKRDAEKLAREIWAAKDEAEAAGAPRAHLADVTATFLERRYFAIPRLVTEVRDEAGMQSWMVFDWCFHLLHGVFWCRWGGSADECSS